MATHSSTLASKIPWTEEPGRLQTTGSRRVRHDWATSLHFIVGGFCRTLFKTCGKKEDPQRTHYRLVFKSLPMPVVALCSEFSVVRGRTRDEWVHFILAGNRSIFSFGEFLMESDDRFFFMIYVFLHLVKWVWFSSCLFTWWLYRMIYSSIILCRSRFLADIIFLSLVRLRILVLKPASDEFFWILYISKSHYLEQILKNIFTG